MNDFLALKKNYPKKIKNIFNVLTLSGKYNVIGSGALEKIKYASDYDLNEIFSRTTDTKKILENIKYLFLKKFEIANADKNIFITDFKCGMNSDLSALRWKYEDIKKGYQILEDGRKMTFEECLLIKTTIKLDIVALIDSRFTEFSEIYYLKLGSGGNTFPFDIENVEYEKNELLHSYDEYLNVEQNYFKALKRIFAYKYLLDPKPIKDLKKLFVFFNSDAGKENKDRADLDVLLLVLDVAKPKISDIKNNLKLILVNYPDQLNKILKLKSKKSIYNEIEKVRNEIYNTANLKALNFITKNKNLLLY